MFFRGRPIKPVERLEHREPETFGDSDVELRVPADSDDDKALAATQSRRALVSIGEHRYRITWRKNDGGDAVYMLALQPTSRARAPSAAR